MIKYITCLVFLALLSACGSQQAQNTPYYEGIKIGKPYEVSGELYVPKYVPSYDEIGVASWYGPGFHGGRTASGERYNQNDMTAAHKTLPLPSIVRVTNLNNGRSVLVRINDRGPFKHDRIIDLSRAAAIKLGIYKTGTAKVRVQYLDQETRDYVSKLPNGKASLLALDRANKAFAVADANTLNASTLPFVSPAPVPEPTPASASAPQQPATTESQPGIFSVADNQGATPDNQEKAGEVYFIQAGTFGVKDNADRLLQELEEMGNAKIVENTIRERTLYRVLAGPFNSNLEAQNMLSRLGNIGISDARIVKG